VYAVGQSTRVLVSADLFIDWVRYHFTERPLLLAAVCALLLAWLPSYARVELHRSSAWVRVSAGIAVASYVFLAIGYAFVATYADHAEPTIPATAWEFWQGGQLYHPPESGPQYSLIYGPLLYLVQAWTLAAFGAGLHVSKLPGVICGLTALATTYLAVRRHVESASLALTSIATMAVIALAFRDVSWWTRSEPELMLCAGAAMLAATWRHRLSGLILGGLTGASLLLKFTGPLYLLPAWVLFAQQPGAGMAVVTALLSASAVAVAPYLHARIQFSEQWYWVRAAAANGITTSMLRVNLGWAIFLSLPLVAAVARRSPTAFERWQLAAVAVALAGIGIAAAKPGGGPYHFLPLLPAIVVMTATLTARESGRAFGIVFTAVLATASLLAIAQQQYMWKPLLRAERTHADLEVGRFLAAHAGESVAVGYGGAYRPSFVRPLPVFAGSPYLLDAAALMELDLARRPVPAATIGLMRHCSVRFWLIPAGNRPFHLVSAYTNREVLPDAFRDAFRSTYRHAASIGTFDVWECGARQGGPRDSLQR
jgi:hypothetical protein